MTLLSRGFRSQAMRHHVLSLGMAKKACVVMVAGFSGHLNAACLTTHVGHLTLARNKLGWC